MVNINGNVSMATAILVVTLVSIFSQSAYSTALIDSFTLSDRRALVEDLERVDPRILLTHCQEGGKSSVSFQRNVISLYTDIDKFVNRQGAFFFHGSHSSCAINDRGKYLKLNEASSFYTGGFHAICSEFLLTRSARLWLNQVTFLPQPSALEQRALQVMEGLGTLPQCPQIPTCGSVSSRIRTFDGSCNNLQNPYFGMAGTALERFVNSDYEDGVSSPRSTSVNGQDLPNPRKITLAIHRISQSTTQDESISHMVMQWGQFLDHDMTINPVIRNPDGELPVCCPEDFNAETTQAQKTKYENDIKEIRREACFNILLDPSTDRTARQTRRTCMPLVRSVATPRRNSKGCVMGPREQVNGVTAFIDGSMVYGSSEREADNLRTFTGGLLKTSLDSAERELLPRDANIPCNRRGTKSDCFFAGDVRVNEQPALASMHTVWVREHNRIARILPQLNSQLTNDEDIYQITRRIVGAQIQRITYNEFLPVLIDSDARDTFGITPKPLGQRSYDYNKQENAQIRNGFASAAYRMGHTLVRSFFSKLNDTNRETSILLGDNFFRPGELDREEGGGMEAMIHGLLSDRAQGFDRRGTSELRDHLFEVEPEGPFLDLFSINIQRAREHGIPGYTAYRKFCQLESRTLDNLNFEDLLDHTRNARRRLSQIYTNVNDIDLFTGGLTESPRRRRRRSTNTIQAGILGPTFQCILGMQFKALKEGDRFFYETNEYNTRLDDRQLRSIQRTTLARIICQNVNIEFIQPNVFRNAWAEGNERVRCEDIRRENALDLGAFA